VRPATVGQHQSFATSRKNSAENRHSQLRGRNLIAEHLEWSCLLLAPTCRRQTALRDRVKRTFLWLGRPPGISGTPAAFARLGCDRNSVPCRRHGGASTDCMLPPLRNIDKPRTLSHHDLSRLPENYFRRVALLGLVGDGYEVDQMAAAGECSDQLQSARTGRSGIGQTSAKSGSSLHRPWSCIRSERGKKKHTGERACHQFGKHSPARWGLQL
jgi:hypothetical protein